jgi:hypothetical protein
MAIVVLTKQLSTDEIKQLLERGFPSYVFEKKSPFLIECNTGLSSKYYIRNSGLNIHISHKITPILAFWLGITVIGAIVYFASANKDTKLLAIVNYIKENQDNSEIPTSISTKIPAICPHCKNPKTKLVIECEWCGNQII